MKKYTKIQSEKLYDIKGGSNKINDAISDAKNKAYKGAGWLGSQFLRAKGDSIRAATSPWR